MKPLLIYGAGGHAACVVAALKETGITPAICLADSVAEPVLGTPVSRAEAFKWPMSFEFIIAIGDCSARKRRFQELVGRGGTPRTVVHPTAYVSPYSVVGAGSVLFAKAVTDPRVKIGENVIVNIGAMLGHDSLVESHSHIAPNVTLCGGSHVGEEVWVGVNSCVLQGVALGHGSFIGAGSVVIKDIPPQMLAYGNPARPRRALQLQAH